MLSTPAHQLRSDQLFIRRKKTPSKNGANTQNITGGIDKKYTPQNARKWDLCLKTSVFSASRFMISVFIALDSTLKAQSCRFKFASSKGRLCRYTSLHIAAVDLTRAD